MTYIAVLRNTNTSPNDQVVEGTNHIFNIFPKFLTDLKSGIVGTWKLLSSHKNQETTKVTYAGGFVLLVLSFESNSPVSDRAGLAWLLSALLG